MFNFSESFGKAMEWLASDQGATVIGAGLAATGDYLAKSAVADKQLEGQRDLATLQHEQRLQFEDHVQGQKDDRNQWVESNLAPLDYSMGANRDSLAGGGKLSSGVLQRMRG